MNTLATGTRVPCAPPAYDTSLPSLPSAASPINFTARRSPLINRGYYSRVTALDKIIKQFLQVCQKVGKGSQIVSLGAGFDTTYWRLKFHHGLRADKYIEIDFPSSVAQKLLIIDHCPALQQVLATDCSGRVEGAGVVNGAVVPGVEITMPSAAGDDNASTDASTDAGASPSAPAGALYRRYDDYGIVGGDLREVETLGPLLQLAGADPTLPTLFVSECVLVYMQPHFSTQVIRWAAQGPFSGPVLFATYEQVHPDDPFGRTMMAHLANRGCALLGLLEYPDLPAQKQRYLNQGFDQFGGWTMNDVYSNFADKRELMRAEKLEIFDELEEWHMIQSHYAISVAYRGGRGEEWRALEAQAKGAGRAEGQASATEETVYDSSAPLQWFSDVAYINKRPPRTPAQGAYNYQYIN